MCFPPGLTPSLTSKDHFCPGSWGQDLGWFLWGRPGGLPGAGHGGLGRPQAPPARCRTLPCTSFPPGSPPARPGGLRLAAWQRILLVPVSPATSLLRKPPLPPAWESAGTQRGHTVGLAHPLYLTALCQEHQGACLLPVARKPAPGSALRVGDLRDFTPFLTWCQRRKEQEVQEGRGNWRPVAGLGSCPPGAGVDLCLGFPSFFPRDFTLWGNEVLVPPQGSSSAVAEFLVVPQQLQGGQGLRPNLWMD